MTDPMELVGRAEAAIPHVASYTHKGLIEELAACIREMVEIVAGFVSTEDDAKANPLGGVSLGGLMDGRDNSGCVYQSASLAALIERARALPLPPAPGAEDE